MYGDVPRIGVIQHLTMHEYEAIDWRPGENVIWVMKHKSGDKRPATLVIDGVTLDLMER